MTCDCEIEFGGHCIQLMVIAVVCVFKDAVMRRRMLMRL